MLKDEIDILACVEGEGTIKGEGYLKWELSLIRVQENFIFIMII
ncbi:hypothetical protein [Clostridium saccharoperbutylacetonicum]